MSQQQSNNLLRYIPTAGQGTLVPMSAQPPTLRGEAWNQTNTIITREHHGNSYTDTLQQQNNTYARAEMSHNSAGQFFNGPPNQLPAASTNNLVRTSTQPPTARTNSHLRTNSQPPTPNTNNNSRAGSIQGPARQSQATINSPAQIQGNSPPPRYNRSTWDSNGNCELGNDYMDSYRNLRN